MIDALVYAVRDLIQKANIGYGQAECEIIDDGRPPPRFGNFFVAVHGGRVTCNSDNNLDERYGFSVTLTARVTIPLDRVGIQLIARNVPLTYNNVPLAQRQGINAKIEQLRGLLHMNWKMTVTTGQTPNSANDNLAAWAGNATVYGFVEPARYRGYDWPVLVGADWIGADPEQDDQYACKSEMRFDGARRMQPQTLASGPFV